LGTQTIPSSAQYVTPAHGNWMKKSQNMPVWVRLSEIGFGPAFEQSMLRGW